MHVYGRAAPGLQALCTERRLPLHEFPWRQEFTRAGLLRDAAYLVRPDGYVTLAEPGGSARAVDAYPAARTLTLPRVNESGRGTSRS